MPLNTASAALHITPVVIKTFLKHYSVKAAKLKDGRGGRDATDDVLFDEAFHIVKAFLELATYHTVESLQAFTNTHVPAPPWSTVVPVMIPFSSCNDAADKMIDWFGHDDLKKVVGGERWWQVRGLDGVVAEWVTEREFLGSDSPSNDVSREQKSSNTQRTVAMMDHLQPIMFYIHGGGYFFGSINTHRYQMIRYARKIRGRVFAVNYRKAPQYPWPCALLDVLAAYLYLINPPKGAAHKPVSPKQLVIAGDSAGGGLALSLLTVLRDLSLPMPAGAVLISPWVDLTHSFPSVMASKGTDIIPSHGFIHRPSVSWPIDPLPRDRARIQDTETFPPPEVGKPDTLKPDRSRKHKAAMGSIPAAGASQSQMIDETTDGPTDKSQHDAQQPPKDTHEVMQGNNMASIGSGADHSALDGAAESGHGSLAGSESSIGSWQPKPPKVLMMNPDDTPLELRSQIQLYATNEQLTHPLVSPVLQGSLGNLCPLYIIAGDAEALRDEAAYLAHRSADPKRYPPRPETLDESRRQMENVERYTQPTDVLLEIYDGMCHVPTVFTFTQSAKHAYRSIAQFVQRVTGDPTGESQPDNAGEDPGASFDPTNRPNQMIRRRVNVLGQVRDMEPIEENPVLKLTAQDIGLLKEAPARRWLEGQTEWDKRYKSVAKRVIKQRAKYEAKYDKLLKRAEALGLVHEAVHHDDIDIVSFSSSSPPARNVGTIQPDRRWGPLDVGRESPPPSAIAGRHDTPGAIALLKKTVYHTAPATVQAIPKAKPSDVLKAAFDPLDEVSGPPKQSVSEEQKVKEMNPMHGLRIWSALMSYFVKKSTSKASKGKEKAVSAVSSMSL